MDQAPHFLGDFIILLHALGALPPLHCHDNPHTSQRPMTREERWETRGPTP